eukprot:CAMPEP_0170630046 /NCGR_PEP_ID=MMETSP0224-20130122/33732_1 /TAXON_ID=285029 /ORGANISM="Togula jolla, Strain CCCM 725" /LENGTH=35 /DNA_ID= /DNA_START= /DNA_END= /DNA_ORIENTATION=
MNAAATASQQHKRHSAQSPEPGIGKALLGKPSRLF